MSKIAYGFRSIVAAMSFVGLAGRREVRRSFADLVELRASLDVHALARESAFVEGAMTELRLRWWRGRE